MPTLPTRNMNVSQYCYLHPAVTVNLDTSSLYQYLVQNNGDISLREPYNTCYQSVFIINQIIPLGSNNYSMNKLKNK